MLPFQGNDVGSIPAGSTKKGKIMIIIIAALIWMGLMIVSSYFWSSVGYPLREVTGYATVAISFIITIFILGLCYEIKRKIKSKRRSF